MDAITYFGVTTDAGDYSFLSNFYAAPITTSTGVTYKTAEHAYQMLKTFDPKARQAIMDALTPGKAKRLGKAVKLRPDWDAVKIPAMRAVLAMKFAPGSELAQRLLDTGDAHLEEGNHWGDKFWGTVDGTGENWLGWLLMAQRAFLRGAP